MAVQTMINNACTMQSYIDDKTEGEKLYVQFYDTVSDHICRLLSGASFVDCFCLEWQLVAFAVNDARIGKVVTVVGKLQGSRAGE